jgi:hypothetical protein
VPLWTRLESRTGVIARVWSLHLSDKLPLLSIAIRLGDLNTFRGASLSLSKKVLLEIAIVHATAVSAQSQLAFVIDADIFLVIPPDSTDGDEVFADKNSPVFVAILLSSETEDEAGAA